MPQPPAWLETLIDEVASCVEADAAMGPLGYDWREEDGAWDVVVYPTPVRLEGGEADGMVVSPGFSLDVGELLSRFEAVADLCWRAHQHRELPGDGHEISVEGTYAGHEVFVRVLAVAPEGEEPGLVLDARRSLVADGPTDPDEIH